MNLQSIGGCRFWPALTLVICWLAAGAGYAANRPADAGQARDFSAAVLARVIPGRTTKLQVEALLGQPWRTTFSDDPDAPGPLVWEYRGQNPKGTYRLHIEFDKRGVTTLLAKIPDKTGEAPARAAPPPHASAD